MTKPKTLRTVSLIITAGFTAFLISCNNEQKKDHDDSMEEKKTMTNEEMLKRGDYIVTTGSCNDCHSPKIMTQMGPLPDSSRLLSGHPADSQLPPLDANGGKPGGWIYMAPDITAFVGPWGISYAANLTPDSAAGIGAWTETQFINTIRNGKHLGDGRDILPPMPWPFIGKLTDEDLKCVFIYLKSLKPVNNKVPAPVAPPDLAGMIKK